MFHGILAAITFATIWFVRAEQENRESTRQAVSVEMLLSRLETLLLDAETGQRGYVLTGEDDYLEPYNRAIAGIDGALKQIEEWHSPHLPRSFDARFPSPGCRRETR